MGVQAARDTAPPAHAPEAGSDPRVPWEEVGVEQRSAYKAAFSADYAEHRRLRARVGNVSQIFIQLGAKMKMLKQGMEERKASGRPGHSHFKKVRLDTYPSYHQEKNRCEYLHQKLSHIKSLILQCVANAWDSCRAAPAACCPA
uniref:OCEL domain-containing protein n=1 Tax=Falco tinnunculus TaxID=100819 RepID=A0A8C4UN00_FALTI